MRNIKNTSDGSSSQHSPSANAVSQYRQSQLRNLNNTMVALSSAITAPSARELLSTSRRPQGLDPLLMAAICGSGQPLNPTAHEELRRFVQQQENVWTQSLLNSSLRAGSSQGVPQSIFLEHQVRARMQDRVVPSVTSSDSQQGENTSSSGASDEQEPESTLETIKVPCRARGMPTDHNYQVSGAN